MIVEIVSKAGKRIDVHVFHKNSISIGRGYDNDLILSDPYIEGEHLQVSVDAESGDYQVEDLATLNGTRLDGDGSALQSHSLKQVPAGQPICIGKTYLRFVSKSEPLARTLKLSSFEPILHRVSGWWVGLVGTCILIGSVILDAYISNPYSEELLKDFNSVLMVLFMVGLYAGFWALIARLNSREARFFMHANLVMLGFVILSVLGYLSYPYEFNFGWLISFTQLNIGVNLVVLTTIFYISCRQATELKAWLCTALGIALGVLFHYQHISAALYPPDFIASPSYSMALTPPSLQVTSGVSRDEFIGLANDSYELPPKDESE